MTRARATLLGVVLVLAASAGVARAQLYRWVDEQGVAHYGSGIDAVPEHFRKGIQPYVPPEVRQESTGPRDRERLHPFCAKSRTVNVGLDGELERVYRRLFTDEVRKDVYDTRVHTIIVPVNTSIHGLGATELERQLAQLLSHELAHAARHAKAEGRTGQLEREADELGVYYYERAGYDCRTWWPVNPPHQSYANRAMVENACQLARQGLRPPRRP